MNKLCKILITVFSWLFVSLILVIIASFSFQNSAESSQTSQTILKLIPFYDNLSPKTLEIFHTLIRKLAHFSIYLLLGLAAFNACYFTIKVNSGVIYALSVGLSSIYALIDEFIFQALSPGRAPMLFDFFIDTLGALIGALLLLIITNIIKRIKNKEIS